MSGNKILRVAMTTIIALGAAYLSFGHIVSLVSANGQDGPQALVYPIVIDALMILCSVTLTSRAVNRMTRFWTRVGFFFGLGCSLAANALAVNINDTLTVIISVVPAITLLITVEVLLHSVKGATAGRRRNTASKPASKPRLHAVS